jgi:hypothetical protein
VRSHYAAELLAHIGYANAFNVLEGFEGEYGAGTNGWQRRGACLRVRQAHRRQHS